MNCKSVAVRQENNPPESNNRIGPFKVQKILRLDVEQYQVTGQWNIKQNAKYAAFIKLNSLSIEGKPFNKLWTQFKRMAAFIKTRNFRQCKSHHHKLFNQFLSIESILAFLFTIYPQFSFFFEQAETELESLTVESRHKKVVRKQKKQQKPLIPLPVKTKQPSIQKLGTGISYQEQQKQWIKAMENVKNSASMMFELAPLKNPFASETSLGHSRPYYYSEWEMEWMECHRLFLTWLHKINALMASQS